MSGATFHFHFGSPDEDLHAKIDKLHADVLRLTEQRDAARAVAETAVDVQEAATAELQAIHDHDPTYQ